MGEALYETLLQGSPALACRIYAPVGSHQDLLAYLVRRLLENGANSSFVTAVTDPRVPIDAARCGSRVDVIADRRHRACTRSHSAAARTAPPGSENSARRRIRNSSDARARRTRSSCRGRGGTTSQIAVLVERWLRPEEVNDAAVDTATRRRFIAWDATPAAERAAALERAADLMEAASRRLIALLAA